MKDNQVERASRIASLILKRMQDTLSPQENAELEAWLHENSENYLLYEEFMDQNKLGSDLDELQSIDHEAAYQRLAARLFQPTPALPKKNIYRTWYIAAAAILVLSAGGYWLLSKRDDTPMASVTKKTDLDSIKPGGKKAVLTLSDGRMIDLDNNHQGIVAEDANNTIQQSNSGNLYYSESAKNTTSKKLENKLEVPRRGEYSITLNDGTIVWLNSSSSLRFPVQFENGERRVKLSGEAYFQVAKDASRPFIVEVDSVEVKALGTEFNITAYPEDKKLGAALVEGVISISHNEKQHLLKPGNIAEIDGAGDLEIKEADIAELTAWKNGEFIFHNTPLFNLMNQFARWYDIDVSYPKGIPQINFTGGLHRGDGIFRVINLLELTGEVRFAVDGRKVMVYPTR
jgi:ferric-dicitrate binding protein FerR (iron transport regulator)